MSHSKIVANNFSPNTSSLFAEMVNDVDAAMNLDTASALLWDNYRLTGEITALPGERDRNFMVALNRDERFVLKVAGPSEPAAVTDLQLAVLRWLAASRCSLSFPRVQSTLGGDDRVTFIDTNGRSRIARLLSYVPGRPLRTDPYSPAQQGAAGEACAMLTLALEGFRHPAATREIIWDVVQGARVEALTPFLPSDTSKAAATSLIARFRAETTDRITALPHQVIHNDLNAGNLMTQSTKDAGVSGVIDFGDVLWTATIADAAIGATSLLAAGCDLVGVLRAYLSGYRRRREPTPEEFGAFPRLAAMRLLLLMVIPAWHRAVNPHNMHYQTFNAEFEVRSAWIRELLEMHGDILAG